MHVFVTGATGWVGSAVVAELLNAGHRVSGLARSADKAATLAASGVSAVRGTLDDLPVLREAAGAADAVIHTAFDHDFSRFAANAEQDRRAIEAMGEALAGTGRVLVVTSGLAHLARNRPATEEDRPGAGFPRQSEAGAAALAGRGLRVATMRLSPTTHGVGENPTGFTPSLIGLARRTGVAAYPGEGLNRWAAVHRSDAARLFRLVVEAGAPAPVFHAAAEEGIPMKEIAAAIGRRLRLPVESRPPEHFGWIAPFVGLSMDAASTRTRELTGWNPVGPSLLDDIADPAYQPG